MVVKSNLCPSPLGITTSAVAISLHKASIYVLRSVTALSLAISRLAGKPIFTKPKLDYTYNKLKTVCNFLLFLVHQLETIMSALDDYSMTVREKLHVMLQASTIATKDGMRNVIGKLLENIKKYPQVRPIITSP